MTERMTSEEMLTLSASAIRKITKWDDGRGASLVTFNEIEAMAFLIIAFSIDALSDTAKKEDEA